MNYFTRTKTKGSTEPKTVIRDFFRQEIKTSRDTVKQLIKEGANVNRENAKGRPKHP
jgi:hypothetical protein